jgi:AAA15 family ATPase/GTPase
MRVRSIRIQNFRSFVDSGELDLSDINVITGENNSGKSSLIKALHLMQKGANNNYADVRASKHQSIIEINLENVTHNSLKRHHQEKDTKITIEIRSSDRKTGRTIISKPNHENNLKKATLSNTNEGKTTGSKISEIEALPNQAPSHYIIPYLSNRKTTNYTEDVSEKNASQISENMHYLSAKIAKVANSGHPHYQYYSNACKEILGVMITAVTSENGQQPGFFLPDESTISIYQMGDGVSNVVHLLTYLATSENKLFLIEEPENDLHPSALKALLNLIIESSQKNQFVISTHSNIVVSHLCSHENSKLFKISAEKSKLPIEAKINIVPKTAEARIQVLQDLGYSFSDYDMWEGWLLLEESSAERIIRDYLIPWFAPKLTKIKTVSANGTGNLEPAFSDLHRLMLFIHLQPAYENRAWVIADGDESGKSAIKELQSKFTSINPNNFSNFPQAQFEYYYPEEFNTQVSEALNIKNKDEKRKAKKELLQKVITWLEEDEPRAKSALKKSAQDVIKKLKLIDEELSRDNRQTVNG